MAKVSRNEKRLVDTVTGRTLSRHKSGMVAQKKAKQLANKTGHAIKLVDDYGVQFVFQPGGGWEHGKSGRSNPKRSRNTGTTVPAHVRINPRTGRIQVFVTPKVAEKLRGGKGLRVAGKKNNPGKMSGPKRQFISEKPRKVGEIIVGPPGKFSGMSTSWKVVQKIPTKGGGGPYVYNVKRWVD